METNFSFYQIILSLLAIFFIVKNFKGFNKSFKEKSVFRFLLINFFWFGVLILILFPQITRLISDKLGMGENLNTLIFTGFIIIVLLILKLFSKIDNLEHDITHLVREESLKKIKNAHLKRKSDKN